MARPHDHDDDLPWLAFRYAAGELEGGAEAAFERRLDSDQEAREALAEAVLLAGAFARSGRPGLTPRPSAFRVPAILTLTAAAAACLVVALGPGVLGRARGPVPVPSQAARPADPAAVALTWSGLRLDAADDPGDGDEPEAPEPNEPNEPLPGWLIEAAATRDVPLGQGS